MAALEMAFPIFPLWRSRRRGAPSSTSLQLETLCLRSTQRTITLSFARFVLFIESLGLQAPLQNLQLNGVVIQSSRDALLRAITHAAHHDHATMSRPF